MGKVASRLSSLAAVEQLGRLRWLRQCLPVLAFGSPLGGVRIALVPALMITLIALIHIDALVRFVIPFYHPPPKVLRLGGFHSFDLTSTTLIHDTQNLGHFPRTIAMCWHCHFVVLSAPDYWYEKTGIGQG